MNHPPLFERVIDLEGRLRLPDFLFDDYQACYISLGLFSKHIIQLTPDGVYLLVSQAIANFKDPTGVPQILSQKHAALSSSWNVGKRLTMDAVGRIKLPEHILRLAQIPPGSTVIGEAGPILVETGTQRPSYWTLEDKQRWLTNNPAGQYTLDYYTY